MEKSEERWLVTRTETGLKKRKADRKKGRGTPRKRQRGKRSVETEELRAARRDRAEKKEMGIKNE